MASLSNSGVIGDGLERLLTFQMPENGVRDVVRPVLERPAGGQFRGWRVDVGMKSNY